MNVDEIVKLLSPEEVELHKDIIAECRQREAMIKDATERSKLASGKIMDSIIRTHENLAELEVKCGDLSLLLANAEFNLHCNRKNTNG